MGNKGEIAQGEWHPAAETAFEFIKSKGFKNLCIYQEAFSSSAIEGNRLAEICSETLSRIMTGQPVSDRYVLGLAWTMRERDKDGN